MTTAVPVGDSVFLQQYLINTRVYGVVVPPDTPPEFWATYEIQSDQGTLMMAAVIGPTGPAGADAFAMHLQTDPYDSPDELPNTLTDTAADIGKYWTFDDVDASGNVIGSSLWIWYGTSYRRLMLGSPGPPGPVPIITPTVALIPPDQNPSVSVDGTPLYPNWHLDLPAVPGPTGPAPAMALCPDVDLVSTPPTAGDLLGTTGRTITVDVNPPNRPMLVTQGSGGTLPAGSYWWAVTATVASGETICSPEVSGTVTGATSSATLTWTPPPGATGSKIYRGTSSGNLTTLVATLTTTAGTYTDTGGGTAGTPPSSNTAGIVHPIWVPVSVSQLVPGPYSMPESAFTSFSGLSQRAPIGSFSLPAHPFWWTPIVFGHIGAFGLELSADPLMIGCEILLGDATSGQQVARGFGNSMGEVNIVPHYSTPTTPSGAITPENSMAAIAPNTAAEIYVNLYNDGNIGVYQFNPTDAQVMVIVLPVTPGG
jgi:hypothetical protein